MTRLEKSIGYSFRDREVFMTALTHSSYANEKRPARAVCNERLEFLGDSILGNIVADHLYREKPALPEGTMTKLRAELVCEQSLVGVAKQISLGEFLRLGKGEELTGGRDRPSILADAVEALIAAMYLDGGIETPRGFISRFILGRAEKEQRKAHDFKTRLQELVQRESGRILRYELVSESGPEHNRTFRCRALIDGAEMGSGEGRTKKESEQDAARAALEKLSV
jgi:ribonuclease-3